jgi:hypothetical protein
MLIIALAIQSTPLKYDDPPPPELKAIAQNADQCVVSQARKLSKSGETAENIAIAAMSECHETLDQVKQGARIVYPSGFADILAEKVRERAREDAIRVVVETKAARHQ